MFNLNDASKKYLYKNSTSYLSIFLIIAGLNLVVFGFYGMWSGLQAISAKQETITEMVKINKDMLTKTHQLEEAKKVYDDAQRYLPYLNVAIPDSTSAHMYLLSLLDVFSKNGFVLERFSPNEKAGDTAVSITVYAIGDASKVVTLAKDIEGLKRFTQINSLDTYFDPVEPSLSIIKLDLRVFKVL